jgi:hypothetical protein
MLQCSRRNCTNILVLGLDHLDLKNLNLPFDLAQGGESFDSAQDREPVERLVEPFRASDLGFLI